MEGENNMALSTKLLIAFLISIFYKSTNNLWCWIQLAAHKKTYLKYCDIATKMNSKGKKAASLSKAEEDIVRKIQENKLNIIDLFGMAGLKRPTITVTKETGYNYVQSIPIDIFDNLDVIKIEAGTNIPDVILRSFNMGIGVYKQRAIDAINPDWLIKFLIFLPSNLAAYLGYPTERSKIKFFVRTMNVAYWFIITTRFFY
jgi:hypothetical protein